MYGHETRSVPDGDLDFRLFLRPFAPGTSLAYELVLQRSRGSQVYDRSIAYLNGADARDLHVASPSIELREAR